MRRAGVSAPSVTFLATDLSTGGGVNKVIHDLAVLFKRRLRLDVSVVNARSERPSSYAFPPDVAVQQHRQRSLLSYLIFLVRLRRSRPDFVVSSWVQDNILVALAFIGSRTKVVLVEHSSPHFHGSVIRALRRIIYPLAWRVVVLNSRDRAHHARYLRRVRLIPNPVTGEPSLQAQREKLIIAVGHLEPLKNFEHAIRAMAASRLEEEGWSLAIVGSGSSEDRLRELINELGLKRTRIHDPVVDLASWYARASLLLVTSRLESFSLVLAEAMACGVIPIAYASDGPSFILESFPDHLVPMGNVDALSERMIEFAGKAEMKSLRQEMHRSIEDRFSSEIIALQWQELLETCDRGRAC